MKLKTAKSSEAVLGNWTEKVKKKYLIEFEILY